MQICRELGGYSYGQADLVRRAMSKKKADVMEKERAHFIDGCRERGISREIADSIFDEMSSFAAYAFNKSHAAAYAMVAYQTAWLKCHWPREYMAALMTSVLDSTGKIIEYIDECSRIGIRVLPPDVNKSDEGFTVVGGEIRFGLLAVKNLGAAFIRSLVAEREKNGPFTGFADFCRRLFETDINKRAVESLVGSGAMDSLGAGRRQMLEGYPKIAELLAEEQRWKSGGQLSLFGEPAAGEEDFSLPDVEEYTENERLTMEKEVTGLYLSGHPMSRFEPLYAKFGAVRIARLIDPDAGADYDNRTVDVMALVSHKRLKSTKNGDNMAFLTLEDSSGTMESLVFARTYAQFAPLLREGAALWLRGRLSLREDEDAKLILESAMEIEERAKGEPVPPDGPAGGRRGEPRLPARGGSGGEVPSAGQRAVAGAFSSADPGTSAQPGAQAAEKLCLRIPTADCPELERIRLLLSIFEGGTPVLIRVADSGKLLRSAAGADLNAVLLRELTVLLGEENVAAV